MTGVLLGEEPHLAGGGGQRSWHDGSVGHLHGQVFVVDERPRPFHLACLEVIPEGPKVRVPKEAAVGVVGLSGAAGQAALVVAHFRAVGALLAVGLERRGQGRQRGAGARLDRKSVV